MSGPWGHMVGVLILVMMAVFIGIWFWAWRPRHRRVFDALAEIPMLDGRAPDRDKGGNERTPSPGPADRGRRT